MCVLQMLEKKSNFQVFFNNHAMATCHKGKEVQTPSPLAEVAEKIKSEELGFQRLTEVKCED